MVDPGDPLRAPDFSEAAWAYHRWPTIGLYTGAGIGLALGVVFLAGWLRTIGFMVALSLAGCLLGLALAAIVYRRADDRGRRDVGDDHETGPGA